MKVWRFQSCKMYGNRDRDVKSLKVKLWGYGYSSGFRFAVSVLMKTDTDATDS